MVWRIRSSPKDRTQDFAEVRTVVVAASLEQATSQFFEFHAAQGLALELISADEFGFVENLDEKDRLLLGRALIDGGSSMSL